MRVKSAEGTKFVADARTALVLIAAADVGACVDAGRRAIATARKPSPPKVP